jgi:hypothetical protein
MYGRSDACCVAQRIPAPSLPSLFTFPVHAIERRAYFDVRYCACRVCGERRAHRRRSTATDGACGMSASKTIAVADVWIGGTEGRGKRAPNQARDEEGVGSARERESLSTGDTIAAGSEERAPLRLQKGLALLLQNLGPEVEMRKLIAAALLSFAVGTGVAQAADVIVRVAPPRAVVEHRGRAPSRDYVWIPGYYRWEGRRYAWERGRWERPPHRHARWVAPRWSHRNHGYVFSEGRWR